MKDRLLNAIRYWGQLCLLPLYWLSFIVPRNNRIWLFGSTFGKRFADNPRYLYLYVSQNKEKLNIRPIWISHNKEIVDFLRSRKYEAYYYHSLKGIYYALVGKVYIYDNYSKDINFWQSGGALKVNLWHGIPLKKIQADNIFDRYRHPKNILERVRNYPRNLSDEKKNHYVLTTSEFLRPIFSSAFRTNNVLISGYPRNDRLRSKKLKNPLTKVERKDIEVIRNYTMKNSKAKMVYYMPTFRDSETKFFDIVDLDKLQRFLRQNNILLCAKLHPKSKLKDRFNEIKEENILVIDADADPYVFLERADILITDYSSIYFDYLLMDRPIIFFDYDLREYLSESREMYFDYDEFTPGEKAKTQESLEQAIIHALDNTDEYKYKYTMARRIIANKVFDNIDSNSAKRLTEDIKMLIALK